MKQILLLIFCFFMGLILGAWMPRSDLRIAEQKNKSLKKNIEKLKRSNKGSPVGLQNILNIPKIKRKRTVRARKRDLPENHSTVIIEDDENNIESDESESLQDAADLWKVRSAYAKELMIEQLNLSSNQIYKFDMIIAEMNNKIKDQIQNAVDDFTYNDNKKPSTREMLSLVNNVSETMIDSYSQLDGVFPNEWDKVSPKDAELYNFIDPMAFKPIINLKK